MEVELDHGQKLVTVWLTRREQKDEVLQEKMKARYAEWKSRKYTVAVFLSGDRDLREQTSALVCYNQRRSAQMAGEGRA